MSNPTVPSTSPHPIIWIAGIAVTLFSLVGIAALTGMLPSPSAAPDTPQALTAAPASTTATTTAAPPALVAESATPAKADPAAPAPVRKPAAKPRNKVATLPPPAGAGVPPDYVAPAAAMPAAPVCASCGVIADIREVAHEGEGTGLGAIGGGIVGGALANNIGKGNGRTLATIAGMVGGGMLGNKIEKTQRQTVTYDVSVRMDDGTHQLLSFPNSPTWRVGDAVKVVNGTLVAR